MSTRTEMAFDSHGTTCHAWYFHGGDSPFAGERGRPVVVMAHGFGGTKDSGLEPFARRLAAAGLAVFAFDYRGFGSSEGQPRQRVSMRGQVEDYRAAIAAAGRAPGADPARIVLWGVSQSGGHALTLAAERADVCAVIALVPMVSGLAAGRHAFAQRGAAPMAAATLAGLRSAVATRLGAAPTMMPLVGRPGERAALTAPGYYESYRALAGPTWRNEVDAAVGLELGGYRADRHADRITAPVLVQIADFDRAAPPQAAAKAAFAARAEVRHYPCDHFDVFAGNPWFDPVVDHQLRFLTRKLGAAGQPAPATAEPAE
ncbi:MULTISPECIES: alpha/beta hydrolase [Nocardia]|uniref:alpha/beta hydrolase n=1 Tax=Nocardia TaxID=1817 RepID=UPI000BEF5E8D|nr:MULTISPECIES: alpha/beta hydrolase [Nocardia]MBF6140878.1 alpha/beta hydrolase [Nocardia farcinica]MBF6184538.1 alpha/beta hydrolase [Nocardia farcinica]MBF6310382.1 alpha/beta hydrolase [Nocardia farcinica]MBF6384481.1 alpha/beta hydrolase [Nocardia farcinica]MBF6405799.1 alpha/beta hydrolase [Nocardia farcinica]